MHLLWVHWSLGMNKFIDRYCDLLAQYGSYFSLRSYGTQVRCKIRLSRQVE
jgi:hypothetical protein